MSVECTITVNRGGQSYTTKARYNDPLFASLYQEGHIAHTCSTCSGKGLCGKCLIKVSGRLNAINPEERSLLGDQLAEHGYRLACFCYVKGDCTVTIPSPEELDLTVPLRKHEYGFTVDIGTDYVTVSLHSITDNNLLDTVEQPNCQLAISHDVQGRIDICNKSPKQHQQLRNMLLSQIYLIMTSLLEKNDIDPGSIVHIYVVGNTCMIHMLVGIDVSTLSDFGSPATRDSLSLTAPEVGFTAFNNATVNITGVISGNVGSDAVAAALTTGMYKSQAPVILVNFGTASSIEILMGNRNILLVSSCNHGVNPQQLTCGSLIAPGVILRLWKEKYKVCYVTENQLPPNGICIAAALEALDIMLNVGIIEPSGKMISAQSLKPSKLRMLGEVNGEQVFFIDRKNKIYLTQNDIYLLQQIKASVLYNIKRMLNEFDITHQDELSAVYLCGQMGGMLNVDSAINIGMLPSIVKDICFGIGNASLQGASLLLHSPRARATAEHIRTYARLMPPDPDEKQKLADCMPLGRF